MGVVYEAYDGLTREVVALKTLKHAGATALYRLKNEFRSLADIAHPNLVSLFELFIEGEVCFFTMELVEGVDFISYTTGDSGFMGSDSAFEITESMVMSDLELSQPISYSGVLQEILAQAAVPRTPTAIDKLYLALRQLVAGLCALHDGGKLHRDIKPSNILVSRAGRVVILDFGLAMEAAPDDGHTTRGFFGTPVYISPEQAMGRPLSPASDWYSVGVTLYQALTGQVPFQGSYLEVIAKKQRDAPVPPSRIVTGVPADLEEICLALLDRYPAARPSGWEVLNRLRRKEGPPPGLPAAHRSAAFVGREQHLRTLHAAFDAVKTGGAVNVYVYGSSGMGKSTLVRTFLRELEKKEMALVLAGRCYERESIPYKAFDGIVDSLTRYLVSLPAQRAQAILPRDMRAITKMFPVLARVDGLAGYQPVAGSALDPLTLRRRAFTSLRDLLGRISDRVPVAIYIDDLHWSDSDSIALLEHLVQPPDAPRLLLVATLRSEEAQRAPHLKSLRSDIAKKDRIEIELDALSGEEARCLAHALLGETSLPEHFVEMVVRESRGNPFLIERLVCWAGDAGAQSITVSDMLAANVRQLPEGARNILETLAIAAHPIPPAVAFRASGFTAENAQPVVASLRSAKFLRSGGARQPLELYHDRIREYVASLLGPERKRLVHRDLAESLVAAGLDDPEMLFEHHLGAGQDDVAARYALLAAAKASGALAFDRAATFFRWALKLSSHPPAETVRLKLELGQALANAGRLTEAAAMYLEAAQGAERSQALDLQRRAAEQLLVSGHVDRGLSVIRAVLDKIGLRLAPGPVTALFSLLARRFELRLRGLNFTERQADEIPANKLLNIDTCWTVAAGLAMIDNIRGADFQTRHLLVALRAGEPYRIARAMAMEAAFTATGGSGSRRRAERISRVAQELAQRVGHPHAIGMAKLTAGVAKFLVGEWRSGLELLEVAFEILHDQCTGVLWEVTSTQDFILYSLLYLGELREIGRRLPAILAMAKERGNLYAATEIKTRMNFHWLAADDPESARRELGEALTAWSHGGFYIQHYNALIAEVQIALYTGDPDAALAAVYSKWADLKRVMLLRIQVVRIEALCLKARAILAVADREPGARPHLLAQAEKLAAAIKRERMPWSDPLAWMLQAGAGVLRADRASATRLLEQARQGFENSGMALHAAVAQWAFDEMRAPGGGRAGRAGQWMEEQDVRNPEGILRVLAPGLPASK